MPTLTALITAHPLRKKPYNAIRFVHLNMHGVPIYRVGKNGRECGAEEALRTAFEMHGGHCFHCKKWTPPQKLSHAITRDHVRPRADGGANILHNLVFACGPCNAGKGRQNLASFNVERGAEYLNALDEHLTRCVKALGEAAAKGVDGPPARTMTGRVTP